MSKTARMIMYPLLVLVVGFFVYTQFFMEKPAPKQVDGTQTTQQVETQTTTETDGK